MMFSPLIIDLTTTYVQHLLLQQAFTLFDCPNFLRRLKIEKKSKISQKSYSDLLLIYSIRFLRYSVEFYLACQVQCDECRNHRKNDKYIKNKCSSVVNRNPALLGSANSTRA